MWRSSEVFTCQFLTKTYFSTPNEPQMCPWAKDCARNQAVGSSPFERALKIIMIQPVKPWFHEDLMCEIVGQRSTWKWWKNHDFWTWGTPFCKGRGVRSTLLLHKKHKTLYMPSAQKRKGETRDMKQEIRFCDRKQKTEHETGDRNQDTRETRE